MLCASGKKSTEVCLLDLNEAVGAVVPKYSNTGILDNDMPANCAERVVAGARALAPYLENRMLAVKLLDKPVVLRELMPQDLWKSTSSPAKEAVKAARFLSRVVGRAHARQMGTARRGIHGWQSSAVTTRRG